MIYMEHSGIYCKYHGSVENDPPSNTYWRHPFSTEVVMIVGGKVIIIKKTGGITLEIGLDILDNSSMRW